MDIILLNMCVWNDPHPNILAQSFDKRCPFLNYRRLFRLGQEWTREGMDLEPTLVQL